MERVTITHPEIADKQIFPKERTIERYKAQGWDVSAAEASLVKPAKRAASKPKTSKSEADPAADAEE